MDLKRRIALIAKYMPNEFKPEIVIGDENPLPFDGVQGVFTIEVPNEGTRDCYIDFYYNDDVNQWLYSLTVGSEVVMLEEMPLLHKTNMSKTFIEVTCYGFIEIARRHLIGE